MKICENIHTIFIFIQYDQGFCFIFLVYKKFGKDFQKLKSKPNLYQFFFSQSFPSFGPKIEKHCHPMRPSLAWPAAPKKKKTLNVTWHGQGFLNVFFFPIYCYQTFGKSLSKNCRINQIYTKIK